MTSLNASTSKKVWSVLIYEIILLQMLAKRTVRLNTYGMSIEIRPGIEADPATVALETFLRTVQTVGPLETYEELQNVIRGEINVPATVAQYVKTYGETATNEWGGESIFLSGKSGKYSISAIVDEPDGSRECTTIHASRRTLPLLRYKSAQSVTLHSEDQSRDQVLFFRPERVALRPYNSIRLPRKYWAGSGDLTISDATTDPANTAVPTLQEISKKEREIFNGFLDTTTWLVDRMLRAKKD